jgi:hypothetical protein
MEITDAIYIVLILARRGAKAPTCDVAAKYSEQFRIEQEAIRVLEAFGNANAAKS